ncbi:aspartate/glutamate racemase family protein [Cohnella sp. AR92]|uniref:aspartate/glutamate racemase family protein n=1 Tax=Cohnella sp. AR92 TaxID=648716 RepID=UPI000F8E0A3D|nr:aspartate/glutamate racemase family protein [Cohnella sp. AR92]RUS43917.1 hypothetical protein ELR57_23920 [Cohnella sp. AR92]
MRKFACLHAHHSNIEYVQTAFASENIEWIHYVDPGLMNRLASEPKLDEAVARNKVLEQIEWIALSGADAILITCTNYIALLEEERLRTPIPIIKIDEPFFHSICGSPEPQIVLFTNPATVEGTMSRLREFAAIYPFTGRVEARVIENAFELVMRGHKEKYAAKVAEYIEELAATEKGKRISVAQLSMLEAAERAERKLRTSIGNPLKALAAHFHNL